MSTDFTTSLHKQIIEYVKDNPGIKKGDLVAHTSRENNVGINKTRLLVDDLANNEILSAKKDGTSVLYYRTGKPYDPEMFIDAERAKLSRKDPPTRKGFVYGIQISGEAPIKIGRTHNIKKRLETIKTYHYKEYIVVYLILVDSPITLESELHALFDKKRISGEWFDIKVEQLRAAVTEML